MENIKYHVVKASRSYSGVGYSGPALKRTTFSEMESASFDNLTTAIHCATQLNEENPVGFEIYHRGQLVWPEKGVRKQAGNNPAVPDEHALRLAGYVLASAKCHEDNYDKEAASEAEKEAGAEYDNAKASGDPYYYMHVVDFAKFYKLTLRQAVEATAPAAFVEPVYLLLQLSWNDALDWAKRITEGQPS